MDTTNVVINLAFLVATTGGLISVVKALLEGRFSRAYPALAVVVGVGLTFLASMTPDMAEILSNRAVVVLLGTAVGLMSMGLYDGGKKMLLNK